MNHDTRRKSWAPVRAMSSLALVVVTALAVAAPGAERRDAAAAATFEQLYAELLSEYWRPAVHIHGIRTTVFDYARMSRDAEAPDSLPRRIVAVLQQMDPATLRGDNARKAFWINAYNFGAMKLVLDHYPVDSIRSFRISLLRHPWSKKLLRIGGGTYSLSQIEHRQLLDRTRDARVVFAVSCAAVSCPDRSMRPFTADDLDAELDELVRTFLANPGKGASLDRARGVLALSWIFDKDAALFESFGGAENFVRPYLPRSDRTWLESHPVRIEFLEHDWTLNDVRLADRDATAP